MNNQTLRQTLASQAAAEAARRLPASSLSLSPPTVRLHDDTDKDASDTITTTPSQVPLPTVHAPIPHIPTTSTHLSTLDNMNTLLSAFQHQLDQYTDTDPRHQSKFVHQALTDFMFLHAYKTNMPMSYYNTGGSSSAGGLDEFGRDRLGMRDDVDKLRCGTDSSNVTVGNSTIAASLTAMPTNASLSHASVSQACVTNGVMSSETTLAGSVDGLGGFMSVWVQLGRWMQEVDGCSVKGTVRLIGRQSELRGISREWSVDMVTRQLVHDDGFRDEVDGMGVAKLRVFRRVVVTRGRDGRVTACPFDEICAYEKIGSVSGVDDGRSPLLVVLPSERDEVEMAAIAAVESIRGKRRRHVGRTLEEVRLINRVRQRESRRRKRETTHE